MEQATGRTGVPEGTKIDFLTLSDFSRAQLDAILEIARRRKGEWRAGDAAEPLHGRVLGLVFHKPSLRTRISFEVGMRQLGGSALYITDAEVGFGKREAIQDIGAVMSRYLDAIMIRTFSQEDVVALARAASVPIINGLTDWVHPCQILSDLLTLTEHDCAPDGLTMAYIGDGNNVANSWVHAALHYEIDLRIASPAGFEPDAAALARVARDGAGRVQVVHDARDAVRGARVIYTDTWTSMGQEAEAEQRRQRFAAMQVNRELLRLAHPEVRVMHCLPAHRGEEITDEVIDGPHSIVYDQAENRLHGQKGILMYCLADGG
ncbi:MAG: ornithine carbamoyltransferase [Candidatus Eisenbacteria bacterium]|nr:ornithine carbamoyltransferase [Candidatus Eisenbacteria bacterium]